MGGTVYDCKNRVASVTGASSNIGLATAQAFVRAGAAVTLGDVGKVTRSIWTVARTYSLPGGNRSGKADAWS